MTAALGNTAQGTPFATGVDAFVYPQMIGYALRAPTTQDIYNPGTRWQDNSVNPAIQYFTVGSGLWYQTASSAFGVSSVTGTANQILATPTTGPVVLSLIGPYTPATYTAHGVLMGEGTSSIAASSAGTSGQVFTSGGASADGAYQNIGTNSGLTAHGVVIAEGTGAFAATAAGTAGQLFVSAGASADPTWTTATFPTAAGATGTILRSNGTGWVASTDTYPNTVVAGDILIATATNVIGSLADVAVGQVLVSGGVGVAPAYSASPSVTGSVTAATGLIATTGGVLASAGNLTATLGNLVLNGAASKVTVNVGTAATASAGTTAALTGGAIVVSTTAITASSLVFFATNTLGTVAVPQAYRVSARTPGVSFTIQSQDATDTSTVNYWIIN